jgi:cysteinyl-tRNA synthetase
VERLRPHVGELVRGTLDDVEERRAAPDDDLLSALLAAEEDGKRLSEEELRSTLVLLFVAGHETTTNLIGNGVTALLHQRDQWERVVADPSLAPGAVEERLRFDGPVHPRAGRRAGPPRPPRAPRLQSRPGGRRLIGHNHRVTNPSDRTPGLEELRLFDTRTRQVQRFEPLAPPGVGIYTCGPTVYAPQTLGNMRSQLFPDLLRRVLLAAGYDVTFVTNITDVGHLVADRDDGDDKMELAAASSGKTAAEVAAFYTEQWATDRRRLGCLEPDLLPRAADHIAEQIAMVQALEAKGHTYTVDDGVYFDVSTFPRYAAFAGLDLDEMETSGRVEHIEAKRHPADFALWKRTPPGVVRQQEWDSPWGRGFPGWHIECSAMATKYLGERFDIHTGGIDHVRVHHTNEVAQSECVLDVHPWVGTWMHCEFLDLGGEKISKSKGHVLTVDTVVEHELDPLAFRYFFLQAHYRQQQAFSWAAMEAAGTALRRLVAKAAAVRDAGGQPELSSVEPFRRRFWAALADDLNAPQALAVVWEVLRSGGLSAADQWTFLADADRALGFGLADAVAPTADQSGSDPRVDARVAERQAARAAKDFATSDRIRDELAAEGIAIVDTPAGPTWRRG